MDIGLDFNQKMQITNFLCIIILSSKNRLYLYLVTNGCYIWCVIFCTSKSLIGLSVMLLGLVSCQVRPSEDS